MMLLTSNDLASFFNTITNTENIFLTNVTIQKILNKSVDDYSLKEQLADFSLLEDIIKSYIDHPDIFHISLLVNPDFIYANSNIYLFSNTTTKYFPHYQEVNNSNGSIAWSAPYIKSSLIHDATPVITIGRLIRSYLNFDKFVGAVYLDVELDTLNNILKSASYYNNSILLYSNDGVMLSNYSPENPITKEIAKKIWNRKADQNPVFTDNSIIISIPVDNTDWNMVSVMNLSEFKAIMHKFQIEILIVAFCVMLIATGISLILSKFHVKRISYLIQQLSYSKKNEFPIIPIVYHDEISELEKHFNNLFQQINKLIDDQFILGQEVQRAHYDALSAQINPHFLYNALDYINLMSLKHHIPEISKVIQNLATFYRLSLNHGKDVITLRDELSHVNAYLSIQNMRFRQIVHVKVNVPDYLKNIVIINLILQPLVENTFLHGICNRNDSDGIIQITAYKNSNHLFILIEDNGPGCDVNLLNHLLVHHNSKSAQRGYGIYNVDRRIKLTYGEEYGLSFSISKLSGLCVTIDLPAREL